MEDHFHFQYRPRLVQRLNEDFILPFAQALKDLFHGFWRKVRLLPDRSSQLSISSSFLPDSPLLSPRSSANIFSEASSIVFPPPERIPSLHLTRVSSPTSYLFPSHRFSAILADRLRGSLNPDGITQNGALGPLRLTNPDLLPGKARAINELCNPSIPAVVTDMQQTSAVEVTYLPLLIPGTSLSLDIAAGLKKLDPSTSWDDWAFLLSTDADEVSGSATAKGSLSWSTSVCTPDETPVLEKARLVSWMYYHSSSELMVSTLPSEDGENRQQADMMRPHRRGISTCTTGTSISNEWYEFPIFASDSTSSTSHNEIQRLGPSDDLLPDKGHRKTLPLATSPQTLDIHPVELADNFRPETPEKFRAGYNLKSGGGGSSDLLSARTSPCRNANSPLCHQVRKESVLSDLDETTPLLSLVIQTGLMARAVRMKRVRENRVGWI